MFQTLYDGFLASMLSTVNGITAEMSATLVGPLSVAASIYITAYGIAILRGSINVDFIDFMIHALKLALVLIIVTEAGAYTKWVGDVILVGIPDFVSTLAGGASGGLPSDGVIARAALISDNIQKKYSAFDLPGLFYAFALCIPLNVFAAVFGAVAFVITLFANFGLALMAAIGPLFVAFALFDFSRGWFFSWLSQILNFAILQLLVTILAVFATFFVGNVYAQASLLKGTEAVIYMLVGLFIVTIFYFLIPSIASALAGGAQASTGTLQRIVERKVFSGGGHRGGHQGAQSGSAIRSS